MTCTFLLFQDTNFGSKTVCNIFFFPQFTAIFVSPSKRPVVVFCNDIHEYKSNPSIIMTTSSPSAILELLSICKGRIILTYLSIPLLYPPSFPSMLVQFRTSNKKNEQVFFSYIITVTLLIKALSLPVF